MLFCVNAGHGRAELAEAAAAQARELAFATTWDAVHPRAVELAARIAGLAPGDLEPRLLHLGRLGVRRDRAEVRARLPPAPRRAAPRQADRARAGVPRHDDGRARRPPGCRRCARRSSRSRPAAATCRTPTSYRTRPGQDPLWAADAIEQRILFEGAETVAAVILEPVQNSGGCLVPPRGLLRARARDLRPPRSADDLRRHDLLLGPARHLVRRPALRLRARRHHDREGADLGLRADGRDDRLRPGRGPVPRTTRRRSRTGSRSAGIRSRRPSRWRTST